MAFVPALLSGIGAAASGAGAALGTTAGLTAAGSLLAGGAAVASAVSKPKVPNIQQPGIKPTPEKSLLEAQQAVDKKRRETLLAGGAINPTGGKGALLDPQNLQKKTLLGQ